MLRENTTCVIDKSDSTHTVIQCYNNINQYEKNCAIIICDVILVFILYGCYYGCKNIAKNNEELIIYRIIAFICIVAFILSIYSLMKG